MIATLKKYLIEHNIPFNISFGGKNHDIENIEVGDYAIIEDNSLMKYLVCDVVRCNFMWLDYDDVVTLLTIKVYNNMVTKTQWKELCKRIGKWCLFEEIENLTYEEAEKYISTMSVWEPM